VKDFSATMLVRLKALKKYISWEDLMADDLMEQVNCGVSSTLVGGVLVFSGCYNEIP
jgi:ASC-1-like (ASCH) protein